MFGTQKVAIQTISELSFLSGGQSQSQLASATERETGRSRRDESRNRCFERRTRMTFGDFDPALQSNPIHLSTHACGRHYVTFPLTEFNLQFSGKEKGARHQKYERITGSPWPMGYTYVCIVYSRITLFKSLSASKCSTVLYIVHKLFIAVYVLCT